MDDPAALALLKTSLGFAGPVTPDVAELLRGKLSQAEARIRTCGLTVDHAELPDVMLLVSVAEYLYRKRDAGPGLPRMLVEEIHERQVAKCTGGAT